MIIQLSQAEHQDVVLDSVGTAPCLGLGIEVDWRLQQQNSALPYRFYAVGEQALLRTNSVGAALCGQPNDQEEMLLFLSFLGIHRLNTDGWTPDGWTVTKRVQMCRQPEHLDLQPKTENHTIDRWPPAEKILELLESCEGRIVPETARQDFYAEICLRRNHRYASIYGIWKGEPLVSTAGLYAMTPEQGYIANIETRLEYQGRGYASALLWRLCQDFSNKNLWLLCEQGMQSFYQRFGFETRHNPVFFCQRP